MRVEINNLTRYGERIMKPLVSIVIPVYNVEQFLDECVQSARKQTYRNLEIILVDDGSTDDSGKKCDNYENNDNRIRVIHKSNGGLSDARNVGIENATGEYIFFLDSDDILPNCAIEKLLNACLKNNADVSIAAMKKFSSRCPQKKSEKDTAIITAINRTETIRRMLLRDGFGHEAWGKLYKIELWQYERFPKGKLYEDYATIYKVISKCQKSTIITEALYWYRVRSGSIMNSKLTLRNMQLIDLAEDVTSYIRNVIPDVENEARYLQMVTYLKLMKGILDTGFSSFPEEQRKIKEYVISCKSLLKMDFVKKKDKIKVHSLLIGKTVFYVVYSLGEKTHK